MNEAQLLEQLSLTDAYAPQTDMPDSAWSHDVAFAEIERRIDEPTGGAGAAGAIPVSQAISRRGWLVAAAMFTAVLILGSGLVIFLGGNAEVPPASTDMTSTTVAPTTTVAPPTTVPTTTTTSSSTTLAPLPPPEGMAAIESFVAAFNAGDVDGLVGMLAVDGEYLDDVTGPPDREPDSIAGSLETIRAVFGWRVARHQSMEIESCDLLDSGRISCLVNIGGDIYGGAGGIRGILKVFVDGGRFSYFSLLEPQIGSAMDPFIAWMELEHPEELDILFDRFQSTDLELWALRASEYAGSQGR